MNTEPYVLFCRRDNPICAAYLPYAINRMRDFCEAYDTDTRADDLAEQVWRMFGAGDRRLGLWLIIANYRIVGHMMAQPEPVDLPAGPWQTVLIRQAEVDKRVNVLPRVEEAFAQCEEWARGFGVKKLIMLTHRNHAAMTRRWGFVYSKALMEKGV